MKEKSPNKVPQISFETIGMSTVYTDVMFRNSSNLNFPGLPIFSILFQHLQVSPGFIEKCHTLSPVVSPAPSTAHPMAPRHAGLELDFDLPQIAVVGGQSVGKSSLLEALVGWAGATGHLRRNPWFSGLASGKVSQNVPEW